MPEKGPLILKSSSKRIVVNTIASYWADDLYVKVLTKSGKLLDLYFGTYKRLSDAMEILDNYFTDIMEANDE